MSVTPSSTIVGIFRDRSVAEQAIEALYNAGFGRDQISYLVPGTSGGFVESLKSIFTGTNANEGDLNDHLTNMGLSDDESNYYANEYNKGNILLAVRAPGREQEALNIMYQHGAYNSRMGQDSFKETANDAQQPSDQTQQDSSAVWGEPNNAQYVPQPHSQTTEEYPYIAPQQNTIASEDDIANEKTQPVLRRHDAEPQNPQSDLVAPEQNTGYEAQQVGVTTPTQYPDYQSTQTSVSSPEETTTDNQTSQTNAVTPEYSTDYQAPQANVVTPEYESGSQTPSSNETNNDVGTQTDPAMQNIHGRDAEMQASQPGAVTTEHNDDRQQLQTQLQALQQQLQEAKAQLQSAREQETQLQSAREREQELQAAKQQLQEAQSELEATLAELRETQARISQYQ